MNAVRKYFDQASVGPDDLNGMLESLGSSPLRQKVKLSTVLLRPGITIQNLRKALPALDEFLQPFEGEHIQQAEIRLKYETYIEKEHEMAEKMNRLEDLKLMEQFDYHSLPSLSMEARLKLFQTKAPHDRTSQPHQWSFTFRYIRTIDSCGPVIKTAVNLPHFHRPEPPYRRPST